MEGLGPKVFLQIRDRVHWWGVGRGWSVPRKALQGPAQLYDETDWQCQVFVSGSLSCGAREVRSPCAWRASPFRTPTAGSLQSWDRRVRPRLVCSTAPTGLRFPPRAPPGQSLLMGDRVGALLKSRAIPSMKPARPGCLYRLSPPFPDLTRHGSLGFSLLCNCHCTLAVV